MQIDLELFRSVLTLTGSSRRALGSFAAADGTLHRVRSEASGLQDRLLAQKRLAAY